MEVLVWIGIMIVFALVKGIGKLTESAAEDSGKAAARRRRVRRAAAPPPLDRSVRRVKTARPEPLSEHQHRNVDHRRKQGGYTPSRRSAPKRTRERRGWQVSMDDLQEFLDDLQEQAGVESQPAAPPPLTRTADQLAEPSPVPVPPPVAPVAESKTPSPYARPSEKARAAPGGRATPYGQRPGRGEAYARPRARRAATRSRADRWTEALRDRANLRNIILAKEIIGPPKALQ